MEFLKQVTANGREFVNGSLADREPWEIVGLTTAATLVTVSLWNFVFQAETILNRLKKWIFRVVRRIPAVRRRVDKEMKEIEEKFDKDMRDKYRGLSINRSLPKKGRTSEDIIQEATRNLNLGQYDWLNGALSGAVYYFSKDLINLLSKIYGLAAYANPLHADVFPGINKMEAEVVRMACELFHGSSTSCGTMTTGGTESIVMACKAYRDYARHEKGITKPEMVLPRTAHAAFEKAATYFQITLRYVEVDPDTTRVNIDKVKKAINKNTIMLVGSAPNFPYGTMDDIESLASLGKLYDIPVHCDCCLGGFLAVFMPKAGYNIPPFDFSVDGVTSISADTHKYGFAPKGSSVVLYSHHKYRHFQYCVTTDWPGGMYGSPTVGGSRAGGEIAACWATFQYFGLEGYVESTARIIETARFIEKELRKIDGLFIFGQPVTSVIAFGSKEFHVYRLSEKLNQRGWNLNLLQFPAGVHICITHMHTPPKVSKKFIDDVKEIVPELVKQPDVKMEGKIAMYGMSQDIPDRSIVDDFTRLYIDSTYALPSYVEPANGRAK